MDKRFEPLATGEVLSIDENFQILIGHRTFRVSELAEAIKAQLEYGISGWTQEKDAWFSEEGIPCEVLRFTAMGWQKGKVRINLEFCPLDSEEVHQEVASRIDSYSHVAEPPVTESEELDLEASAFDMSDEIDLRASAAVATAAFADEVYIEESVIITQEEFELDEPGVSDEELESEEPNAIYAEMEQEAYTTVIQDDEFDMADEVPISLDDEFGMEDQMATSLDDEFGMEDQMATSLDDEFGMEDQMATSLDDEFGMEDQMATSLDDEFGIEDQMATSLDDEFGMEDQMATSLDDEFDQISESIEQELELVEAPQATSDELLDLSDMSTDDDDLDFGELSMDSDENIDFGEMSASGEGEFQFEEISFNSELEEDEGTDSLLDDVWQDINQPSWQNNQ